MDSDTGRIPHDVVHRLLHHKVRESVAREGEETEEGGESREMEEGGGRRREWRKGGKGGDTGGRRE